MEATQEQAVSPLVEKAMAFQATHRAGLNLQPAVGLGCYLDPLDVMRALEEGGEDDPFLLVAAVLHDLLEHTSVTEADVAAQFGSEVAYLVAEVADHPKLSLASRKAQLARLLPQLSRKARLIRFAQLIASVRNLASAFVPAAWSPKQRGEYVDWAEKTATAIGPLNATLHAILLAEMENARLVITSHQKPAKGASTVAGARPAVKVGVREKK